MPLIESVKPRKSTDSTLKARLSSCAVRPAWDRRWRTSETCAVVFGVRRKDNNVVDIYEGGSVEKRSQDGLDESLECRGGIG